MQILEAVAPDVAQRAYRATLESLGSATAALASVFTTNPIATVVALLISSAAQRKADAEVDNLSQPAA